MYDCMHKGENLGTRLLHVHCHELKNISLSVAPPLMERSYRSIPSRILTAHME